MTQMRQSSENRMLRKLKYSLKEMVVLYLLFLIPDFFGLLINSFRTGGLVLLFSLFISLIIVLVLFLFIFDVSNKMKYIFNTNIIQVYLVFCFIFTIFFAVINILISSISYAPSEYLKDKFSANRYILVAGYEIFEDDEMNLKTYEKEKLYFSKYDTVLINDFKKSISKDYDYYDINTFFWQTAVLKGFQSGNSKYVYKPDSILAMSYLSMFGVFETCIITIITGFPFMLLVFILNFLGIRMIPEKYFEEDNLLRVFDN
jgi:hypothetical protein